MNRVEAVGIDLGTTYSVISIFRDDQTEIIHNEQGRHTTASWVAFTNQERIVGDSAKQRAILNPQNAVHGVKRFIGRSYDDPEFQEIILNYSYDIVEEDQKPVIEVNFKGEVRRFAPEEISAMVLEKMKSLAENFVGHEISKAVITVPAHFNDAQREATKTAGRIAGLEILRIINEPTAAALAYGLHNKYKELEAFHTILVYDFGGGTFDVSIISIENEIFEVKSTNGEAFLGGDDIDTVLTEYFINEFKQKNGIDLTKNKRAIRRLRHQCEKLKRNLSFAKTVFIDVELIYDDIDLTSSMDREKFETLTSGLFNKTLTCVEKALKDARMKKEDINEVILIGGSTRIPRVRELVQKFFDNKELNACLNPDEAVARGAAVQAAILTNATTSEIIKKVLLYDVTPLSLGIETTGGEMCVIIPKNTQLPTSKTEGFETSFRNQTEVCITVYEGEGSLVSRNRKVGEYTISGLPKKPQGEVKCNVNFEIDINGILNVTADVIIDGNTEQLQIFSNKCRLTEKDVQRMIEQAEKYRAEDEKLHEVIQIKIELMQIAAELKDKVMNIKELNDKDKKLSEKKFKEINSFLDEVRITAERCREKIEEIKDFSSKILNSYEN